MKCQNNWPSIGVHHAVIVGGADHLFQGGTKKQTAPVHMKEENAVPQVSGLHTIKTQQHSGSWTDRT